MTAWTTSAPNPARRETQDQVSATPIPRQKLPRPKAQAHATATARRAPVGFRHPRGPSSRLHDIHLINAEGEVGGGTTHAERKSERNVVQGYNQGYAPLRRSRFGMGRIRRAVSGPKA